MASYKPKWVQSLTFGFVHEQEKQQQFYMDIPTAIIWFIINYIPVLYKFGLHNKGLFEVSDDGLSLKSKAYSCDGYMIYADLFGKNDTGFNKGVHFWTLYSDFEYKCYKNMGVTTVKNSEILELYSDTFLGFGKTRTIIGYHYCYDAGDEWKAEGTWTVKLDCDNWKVSFYMDEELVDTEDIEPNQHYFLAISCCNRDCNTSVKVVETPQSITEGPV